MRAMPAFSVIIPLCHTREVVHLLSTLPQPLLNKGKMEVILVYNSPKKLEVKNLTAGMAEVKWVVEERYLGYAGAAHRGAEEASHEILVFLNDDVRLEDSWFDKATKVFETTGCDGVAGYILDAKGRRVDFGGAGMNLFGYGIPLYHGELSKNVKLEDAPCLFACGASFAVKRKVYEQVGGYDPDFFAFFEDVDLGWRMNMAGYRIFFAPSVISYHQGASTTKAFGEPWHHFLLQRNSLFALYKNYSDENLPIILPMAEAVVFEKAKDCRKRRKLKLASAFEKGFHNFLEALPQVKKKREQVQKLRQSRDEEIFPLFKTPLQPAYFNSLTEPYLRVASHFLNFPLGS